jgi:hypothetical protein
MSVMPRARPLIMTAIAAMQMIMYRKFFAYIMNLSMIAINAMMFVAWANLLFAGKILFLY